MKLPNGLINESPNTIESAETMHVYNAEHPLPENALRRWGCGLPDLSKSYCTK